jgi:hypothetical protein
VGDWALRSESGEPVENDANESDEPGDVDDTLAARRLRRWLKAMFGSARPRDDTPEDD